jgi:hypothetical protein
MKEITDLSQIPDWMTEEQAAEFWETHCLTEEFLEKTPEVPEDERPRSRHAAVCVDNTGYPVSLQLGKAYRVLPDAKPGLGLLRVVDESGEAYLYSASRFK